MKISIKIFIVYTLLLVGCSLSNQSPDQSKSINNEPRESINNEKLNYVHSDNSFSGLWASSSSPLRKLTNVLLASLLFPGGYSQTPAPTIEPPDELRPITVLENEDMYDLLIPNSQFLADTGSNELLATFIKDENNGKGTIVNIDNNANNTLGWQLTLDNILGSTFSSVIQLDGLNMACGSVNVMGDGLIAPTIHSDILIAVNSDAGANIHAINLEVRLQNGTFFIGRDENCISLYPSGPSSGIFTSSIVGSDIDDHLYIANISGLDGSIDKDYAFRFPQGVSELVPITKTSNDEYVVGLTSNNSINLLRFDSNLNLNNTYRIPLSSDSILHSITDLESGNLGLLISSLSGTEVIQLDSEFNIDWSREIMISYTTAQNSLPKSFKKVPDGDIIITTPYPSGLTDYYPMFVVLDSSDGDILQTRYADTLPSIDFRNSHMQDLIIRNRTAWFVGTHKDSLNLLPRKIITMPITLEGTGLMDCNDAFEDPPLSNRTTSRSISEISISQVPFSLINGTQTLSSDEDLFSYLLCCVAPPVTDSPTTDPTREPTVVQVGLPAVHFISSESLNSSLSLPGKGIVTNNGQESFIFSLVTPSISNSSVTQSGLLKQNNNNQLVDYKIIEVSSNNDIPASLVSINNFLFGGISLASEPAFIILKINESTLGFDIDKKFTSQEQYSLEQMVAKDSDIYIQGTYKPFMEDNSCHYTRIDDELNLLNTTSITNSLESATHSPSGLDVQSAGLVWGLCSWESSVTTSKVAVQLVDLNNFDSAEVYTVGDLSDSSFNTAGLDIKLSDQDLICIGFERILSSDDIFEIMLFDTNFNIIDNYILDGINIPTSGKRHLKVGFKNNNTLIISGGGYLGNDANNPTLGFFLEATISPRQLIDSRVIDMSSLNIPSSESIIEDFFFRDDRIHLVTSIINPFNSRRRLQDGSISNSDNGILVIPIDENNNALRDCNEFLDPLNINLIDSSTSLFEFVDGSEDALNVSEVETDSIFSCDVLGEDVCAATTSDPTLDPTILPSMSPSLNPTQIPTISPTLDPSPSPTTNPSISPTLLPTNQPTISPTPSPSPAPSPAPTDVPTPTPVLVPSLPAPTPAPVPSLSPTDFPTCSPMMDFVCEPSQSPTCECDCTVITPQPTNRPTSGGGGDDDGCTSALDFIGIDTCEDPSLGDIGLAIAIPICCCCCCCCCCLLCCCCCLIWDDAKNKKRKKNRRELAQSTNDQEARAYEEAYRAARRQSLLDSNTRNQ